MYILKCTGADDMSGLIRLVIFLVFLFVFTESHAQSQDFLTSNKNVCTVAAEETTDNAIEPTCSIRVMWNYVATENERVCLYDVTSQDLNLLGSEGPITSPAEYQGKIACGNNGSILYENVKVNKVSTLELRSENNPPFSNELPFLHDPFKVIPKLNLIGLDSIANPVEPAAGSQIKQNYFKKLSTGLGASSWDGRLFFKIRNGNNGGKIYNVRVLRPSKIEKVDGEVYFDNPDLFSAAAEFANEDDLGTSPSNHLTLYPDPGTKDNPYRSNEDGFRSSTGNYKTYQIRAIMVSQVFQDGASTTPLKDGSSDMKSILGTFSARVIVKDPDTDNATIHSTRIDGPASALRHSGTYHEDAGPFIYGHEPSVSLDGNLIVYSGNAYPTVRRGHGGMILYTYTRNPNNNSNWSQPRNISEMYMADGPGSGAERLIHGMKFSDRFPIAKYPIVDYEGEDAPLIFGAYPWVSFDSSEVMFSSIPTFHGPRRNANLMVGARTRGILTHLDGDINLVRGNPTDTNFRQEENGELKVAYEALMIPGDDRCSPQSSVTPLNISECSFESAYRQVLPSPIGLYGTSWSPFSQEVDPILPISPHKNSYGFFFTSQGDVGKYVEAQILDNFDDLLLYYPMNEPVKMNSESISEFVDDLRDGEENRQIDRYRFNYYIKDKTPDYSQYHHTGDFIGWTNPEENELKTKIGYPFEYHDVLDEWVSNKKLLDVKEGFYGNSVFFEIDTHIEAEMNEKAIDQIIDSQAFTVSYWLNRDNQTTPVDMRAPVFLLDNIFSVWMLGDRIGLRVFTDIHPTGQRISVPTTVDEPWNHFLYSYKSGKLSVYLNGELISTEDVEGALRKSVSGTKLSLGPRGVLDGGTVLQLDEVHIYGNELSDRDIQRLAWIDPATIAPDLNGPAPINVPSHLSELPQEYTDLSSFDEEDILLLGHNLFESDLLSPLDSDKSCSSCHIENEFFTDPDNQGRQFSEDATRNTPTLVNLLFGDKFLFDGRAESLEEQVLHPILNPNELGDIENPDAALDNIRSSDFDQNFKSIFGRDVNFTDLSLALSRYIRSLMTEDVLGDDSSTSEQLSTSEQRGKDIFFGFANCVACHSGPNFTDNSFHNIGLASQDKGRGAITGLKNDMGKFKTPTLLNIAKTPPYFHDGSAASLQDVINHYLQGGVSENTSTMVRPFGLTDLEQSQLIDYLESLNRDLVDTSNSSN